MTQLTDLMAKGFKIQISDMVTPDTVFPVADEDGTHTLVFHPFNYSYISNDDVLKAHEINMLRIYQNIEQAADEACTRLDKMVDEMNHKHDPHIMGFLPNTEVIENEDGSYTFVAVNPNSWEFYRPTRAGMSEDEILRRYTHNDE